MKKGFTLLELLAVILIISIASFSSIIAFSSINDNTKESEKKNRLMEMQKAAILYYELNDYYVSTLADNCTEESSCFITVMYSDLISSGYLKESDYKSLGVDNWAVKISVKKYNEQKPYLDTSIVVLVESDSEYHSCNLYDSEGNDIKNQNTDSNCSNI